MRMVMSQLVDELKRTGHLREAEHILEAAEAEGSEAWRVEQLAIVQRRRGRWRREMATLGRYVARADENAATGLMMRLNGLIRRVVPWR
jgi:hypothetical protein